MAFRRPGPPSGKKLNTEAPDALFADHGKDLLANMEKLCVPVPTLSGSSWNRDAFSEQCTLDSHFEGCTTINSVVFYSHLKDTQLRDCFYFDTTVEAADSGEIQPRSEQQRQIHCCAVPSQFWGVDSSRVCGNREDDGESRAWWIHTTGSGLSMGREGKEVKSVHHADGSLTEEATEVAAYFKKHRPWLNIHGYIFDKASECLVEHLLASEAKKESVPA